MRLENSTLWKKCDNKIEHCLDLRKTKMICEFNNCESASIKLLAVKKKELTLSNFLFYVR